MQNAFFNLRILLCLAAILGLIYLIATDRLGDFVYQIDSATFLSYSIFLFILSSIFLAILVLKYKTFTPSTLLYLFFLSVPTVGYFSYRAFTDLHGNFHGEQLSFDYPVFVWAVGTAFCFGGILIPHLFRKRPPQRAVRVWDHSRTSVLLWVFLGISVLAAIVVISKIGYLPILNAGIDEVRWKYEAQAGRYVAKLSRLFIVVSSIATVLFFATRQKKRYLIILLVSTLGLTLYGERLYLFWAVAIFGLFYFKYRTPRLSRLVLVGCAGIASVLVFLFMAENRAGRLEDRVGLQETLIEPLFSEYSYYAFVVNEIKDTEQYLGGDIFWGALVKLFPRQVWAGVGVDKDLVMEKHSAVGFFGEWFKDTYGTRITPIGEAYAGYGLVAGVGLQLFLLGLVFGLLERAYMVLDKRDIRLCIICFLMSLFLWLPLASLGAIIDPAVSYGGFFLLCQLVGLKRTSRQIENFS